MMCSRGSKKDVIQEQAKFISWSTYCKLSIDKSIGRGASEYGIIRLFFKHFLMYAKRNKCFSCFSPDQI